MTFWSSDVFIWLWSFNFIIDLYYPYALVIFMKQNLITLTFVNPMLTRFQQYISITSQSNVSPWLNLMLSRYKQYVIINSYNIVSLHDYNFNCVVITIQRNEIKIKM